MEDNCHTIIDTISFTLDGSFEDIIQLQITNKKNLSILGAKSWPGKLYVEQWCTNEHIIYQYDLIQNKLVKHICVW